jgi:predicted GNAT family acetyltransferase
MRITVVDVPDRARFELWIEDELVGWATYHVSDGAVTLPLTEVDPTQHGRGLGTILVRGVLAALRQRRLRVLPYCPFVRHYLLTHPDELHLVSAADRPRFGLPPLLPPQTEDCGEMLRGSGRRRPATRPTSAAPP